MEQVRLAATTTNNVVTYPVVVTVDNSDGTLLPGLTVNAEIEVSKREGVLRIGNAALRFKPAEGSPLAELQAPGAPAGGGAAGAGRGPGIGEDLQALAGTLGLSAQQKAAFDAALEEMQRRQAERMAQAQAQQGAQAQQQGGNRLFGGGGMRMGGGNGGANPAMLAQMRARMRDRLNQQFGGVRVHPRRCPARQVECRPGGATQRQARAGVQAGRRQAAAGDAARSAPATAAAPRFPAATSSEGDLIVSGERSAAESK